MHTVILELIDHVCQVHERVIDSLHRALWVGGCCLEDKPPDAAEAIDAHGARHGYGEKSEATMALQPENVFQTLLTRAKVAACRKLHGPHQRQGNRNEIFSGRV